MLKATRGCSRFTVAKPHHPTCGDVAALSCTRWTFRSNLNVHPAHIQFNTSGVLFIESFEPLQPDAPPVTPDRGLQMLDLWRNDAKGIMTKR
jgi:hypothetical protein